MGNSTLLATAGLIVAAAFTLSGPSAALEFVDTGSADPAKASLGKLLFFDKELSGN